MAVFKINKNENYTVISNTHLREKEMSLKAKGLLTLMLSLPPSWDYSIEGLISICLEGERAINSTLSELKEFGYLRIEKIPPRKGKNQFEYIYNIYEIPLEKEERQVKNIVGVQNVGLQIEDVQNEKVQNAGQLNTNTLSTEELNTKELNTYLLLKEEWNKIAKQYNLTTVQSCTKKRKKAIEELLKKYNQETIIDTMKKISKIEFLLGKGKNKWKISFDNFLEEDKFVKVLEGGYYDATDNRYKSNGSRKNKTDTTGENEYAL